MVRKKLAHSKTGSRFKETERRVLNWLLEKDQPAVRYYAQVDLLGESPQDPDVRSTFAQIPKVGWGNNLLATQGPKGYWEAKEPTTAETWIDFLYYPKYGSTIWRALVLSDLGLTSRDPRIGRLAEMLFKYKLQLGSMVNIFNDEVCIVGNTARMLTRFGYGDDPRVRKLYDRLVEDQREDGGWHCRQGGLGTLDGWEALAAFACLPASKRTASIDRAIARGAEFYLSRGLFKEGKRKYLPWFRFHYPIHYYYDFLVGLDMLTRLGFGGDQRLNPALRILRDKRRPDGTWAIDRSHPDVGSGAGYRQHRKPRPLVIEKPGVPSKWITLTALRVLDRVRRARGDS